MLTFHPLPDETYHYTVSEQTHTLSTENGQKVQRDQNVFIAFRFRLADKQTDKQTRLTMDAFTFHEQKDDKQRDAAADCAGTELTGDLRETGSLANVNGLDNLYGKLDPSWRVQFGERYFAGLMGKGWGVVPGKAVRVGDSWNGLDSLNADPRIPLATRYTLVKDQDGILVIQADADVDLTGATGNGQLTLKGRQRGVWRIDAVTGMVLGGNSALEAEGTLTTPKGTIPMHIDSACRVNGIGA
jgi:hypothetical protein